MKTNKVIIETENWTKKLTLKYTCDMTQEAWEKCLQPFVDKEIIINVYDGNTHHICKYCGEVAKGIDDDILCENCRDTFGHAFYSEL